MPFIPTAELWGIAIKSRILRALNSLVKLGILKVDNALGRPHKEYGRRKYYRIVNELGTLEKLLRAYSSDAGHLLKSNFINKMIMIHGFSVVYDLIKPEMVESTKFREIASKFLLTLPATIDDYNKIGIKIIAKQESRREENKCLQDQVEMAGKQWSPQHIKPIEILASFNPLEAVRLYRRTLFEKMYNAHRTASPECYHDFLYWDMYLSPFTSSPINHPVKLLFLRPFERLYEDGYLIDDARIGYLVNRAYAIYLNFPEIMIELFKASQISKTNREVQTKQYIYFIAIPHSSAVGIKGINPA